MTALVGSAIMEGESVSANPHVAAKTDFQALLCLVPEPNDDRDLKDIAALALEALLQEAAGLALGPVVCVDLDNRVVEMEMTVEAVSASEVHQKIGLIVGALERGAPFMVVRDSKASRSETPTPDLNRELVSA